MSAPRLPGLVLAGLLLGRPAAAQDAPAEGASGPDETSEASEPDGPESGAVEAPTDGEPAPAQTSSDPAPAVTASEEGAVPADEAPAEDPGAPAGGTSPPAAAGSIVDPNAAPPDGTPKRSRLRWGGIGLPLVNFNTTDGLGFGAGAEVYSRPRGQEFGYLDRITASTFWTTSGNYSSNYLQYERRGKHQLVARATYRIWRQMIYVGQGGADVSVRQPESVSLGNKVIGPSLLITGVFRIPRSPLFVWVQGYLRYSLVEANPNGLLAGDLPWGSRNGWYFDTSFGGSVQETDRWPMPNKGVRSELSVRFGGSWSDNEFRPLVGMNAEVIGWWPLVGEWFVVGGRFLFDKTWGDRPFYEQEWLGGLLRDEAAYEQALTGYGRSRTRGDGHLATMIELRTKFGQTRHPVVDIGFYFSAFAESGFLFDGDDPGPHMPTVGFAPELLWQGATQLRPFIAWGWLSDEPGGTRTPSPQVGISLLGPL